MSPEPSYEFDHQLLDYHLGSLSAAEQAGLKQRLAEDPALATQDEALRSVVEALRSVPRDVPPTGLADRVLDRVRKAGPPPRIIRPVDEWTRAAEATSVGIIRLRSLREIVGVAAIIVLAIGLGVPGLMHLKERGQRLGCSWNLAQIGAGVQQYAAMSAGSLPFAGWGRGNSWQPTDEPNVVMVPNHRHVYALLRRACVTDPRVFICPGQRHMAMPMSEVASHDDFLDGRNVSYAYQNMAGVRPSAQQGDPRMPIMADENPLFADGIPLLDPWRLARGDRVGINSRAHHGAGQNILTLTGQVIWATTPAAGVDGDNIWTLKGVTEYTGREGPASATDSHLLK